MDDTVLREATTEDSKQVDTKVVPKNPDRVIEADTDTPIALYVNLEGYPYTAKHFGVKGIWDNPDIGLNSDILTIEEAYQSKVSSGELEDGVKTYESFVKEAEKATSTKDAPAATKIPKIAEWVKFMSKMDSIDQERKRHGYTAE